MKKYTISIFLICNYLISFSTDYYVSSLGADSNNGTTTSTAWSSIDKVRTYASNPGFVEGDNVYFEGGKTFTTTNGI